MPRVHNKLILIFISAFVLGGCRSAKDITVRNYIQEKDRIDQEISGAVGNWENAPTAVDTSTKQTRKVYVLEFTKEANLDEGIDVKTDQSSSSPTPNELFEEPLRKTPDRTSSTPPPAIPSFDDEQSDQPRSSPAPTVAGEGSFVDYKVEKDDTLQKISKKFYDSYSKWPQIYEANKSVIKDPNRIKPGITIKIPVKK